MMPNDVFSFVKKKVLQAPESSSKPRARPKPSRSRNSTLSTTVANQRYGVSESTIEAYKSASAGRRSSSVYGDAKALEKFRQTISTGFQTATDTVNKLTVPGGSASSPSGGPSPSRSQTSATPRKSITTLDAVATGIVVSTPDEEIEDWNGNENEEENEEVLQVLEQLNLEAKRDSIDQDTENGKQASGVNITKPPDDPRCKVCFKQIGESEYFRVCSGCVRRVCEDCSASYKDKDEPEYEWQCSICIRGSTNREVPPSQSFLRASAAAQQRKQLREQQLQQQQQPTAAKSLQQTDQEQVKDPPSPIGMAAIINRVAKKQESFDAGGPKITERSISSGLMVPEQSSLRRHSTGNAAVSAAALKSLKDAAAAAEDVKNKLTEQRRPSYSRLPVQQQQPQQQPQQLPQQQQAIQSPDPRIRPILKTGSQEALKIGMIANNIRMQQMQRTQQLQQQQQQQQQQMQQQQQLQQQQQPKPAQPMPVTQQRPQLPQPKAGFPHQVLAQAQRKPIPTRGNSSNDLNWQQQQQQSLAQPLSNRRASSVYNVQQDTQFNRAGSKENFGSSDLLGPRQNDERRASFESAMSDSASIPRLGVQLTRAQHSTSELRSMSTTTGIKDRNFNNETKSSENVGGSDLGRNRWKGNQQLSGEGIQIVVDHVDRSEDPRRQPQNNRHGDTSRKGSFSAATNASQVSLYRVDEQDPYGFGLRVVGQQLPADPQQQQQQLCARVLWISPGGPAQRAGIKVGDKILEWDGIPLSSLPIERIPQMIEHSEKRRIDLILRCGRPEDCNNVDNETAGDGSNAGRRRLPTLPQPRSSPRASFSGPSGNVPQVQPKNCGWVQMGVGHELSNLVVTVWSAEGLPMVESAESLSLPKPYAIVRLSVYGSSRSFTTEVDPSSQNPVWSTKHLFPNIDPESLIDAKIDVAVWNFSHSAKQQCLGKTSLDVNVIELDSALRWYPLHNPSADEIGQIDSQANLQKREVVQLPYKADHITPSIDQQLKQKLRASQEFSTGEHHVGLSPFLEASDRFKMRRKSDCYGDQRSALAAAFGSNQSFGQAGRGQPEMSGPEVDRSRRNRSLDRSTELEQFNSSFRGSGRGLSGHAGAYSGSTTHLNLQLGPLQLPPRGYGHNYQQYDFPHYGELKLGFFLSDTHLEVEVVTARDLPNLASGKPDTFVKTYLSEGDRRFLLRKTGVARHLPNAGDPLYRQTVKYLASDISRRSLVAMVVAAPRQKMSEFDPMTETTLGVAEIDIDKIARKQLVAGWYRLFAASLYNAEHDSN